MSCLVLANVDYAMHTSSEGWELQEGLKHADWTLCGNGYGTGSNDVRSLLDHLQPQAVLVSDRRDFDPESPGSFRKDVGFRNLGELAKRPEVFKIAVIKDAGGYHEYHQRFCEEIGANATLIYYHEKSVLQASPWITKYPLIRTYHTVDSELIDSLKLDRTRKRAIVTGAAGNAYPLRWKVIRNADILRCDHLEHPGYSNKGVQTPRYLKKLADYKVHIATASIFRFALRKIIESVAVGCIPVTDLPKFDALPHIDGALFRVPADATIPDLKDAIDQAERSWDFEERMHYSRLARLFYDYRRMGLWNNVAIKAEMDRSKCESMA